MSTGDIKTFDIITADLVLKVYAIDLDGAGQVRFDVQWVSGSGDVNAIYWGDNGVADGSQFNLGGALNMNGGGQPDYDAGLVISQPGSSGGVNVLDKDGFLNSLGDNVVRDFATNWNNIDTLGIRATSTGPLQEGSIKSGDGTVEEIKAPKISINDQCVYEEDGSATFTVTLDHAYPYDITMNYATANGSAGASDFTPTNGSFTILAGQTTYQLPVEILDDLTPESTEGFTMNLSNASADIPGTDIALPIYDAVGDGTIKDTDVVVVPPPVVENFPDNGHDLSYATFYFQTENTALPGDPDGDGAGDGNPTNSNDGVYTVKANFAGDPSGDLDDYYADLLADIIVLDPNVTPLTPVLGVAIHAGLGAPNDDAQFYALDGNELANAVPTPPGDAAMNNEVDETYQYTVTGPTTGNLLDI